MKKLIVLIAGALTLPLVTQAQGTAFTYQGYLDSGGAPHDGLADFEFSLWDAVAGGTQQGSTLTESGVEVEGGLFTVQLDFGDQFPSAARWLEISVRTNAAAYTTLAPRQRLTATPYAITAGRITGPLPANQLSGTIPSANVGGTYSSPVIFNNAANTFAGDGSGLSDLDASELTSGTVPAAALDNAWKIGGNTGTAPGPDFIGTADNQALELHVNNARALRLEPNIDGPPNVIGGDPVNYVAPGVVGATIGGGGETNQVLIDFGTVAGGRGNIASSDAATVGGGRRNRASSNYATVSGGWTNIASGPYAVVGGGRQNTASTSYTTISGGERNTADGLYTTIGGGEGNNANGSSGTVGGGTRNTVDGGLSTVAGGMHNTASARSSTVGGGQHNTANIDAATVGGGITNLASGVNATVSGGATNVASGSHATVGGGGGNLATGLYATVGGGWTNTAGGNYATVAGGLQNTANGLRATVGGGERNIAGSTDSTVGGGWRNNAYGLSATIGGGAMNLVSNEYATVGGGLQNIADGNRATVGGGEANIAGGTDSTVAGGYLNIANGIRSTVPGGHLNTANGNYSFAAGRHAKALHEGAFVWGDATNADVASLNVNSVTFRASGGYRLFSTSGLTAGVSLAAGGTSWGVISDQNMKRDIEPVDVRAVLEKLASLPVSRWRYEWETAESPPHIGPMAQDFKAAFFPGADDTVITTLEADGVALAAIQGLNQKVEDEVTHLRNENQLLRERLEQLERMVTDHLGIGSL